MPLLAWRERDVHLIEAEEILLAGRIGGDLLVAIEHVAHKGGTLGFRQMCVHSTNVTEPKARKAARD